MTDNDRGELKALVELTLRRKALIDAAAVILKNDRATLESAVEAGERVGTAATGFATMSNPAQVIKVVDEEQLQAFIIAEGGSTTGPFITDEKKAVEVLREHAPELVQDIMRIPEHAVTDAKARAKKGENIPGIAVIPGTSTLSLRPSEDVKAWAHKAIGDDLAALEVDHG